MKLYRIITLSIAWMIALSLFSTKISPVIISEVFYDSPLVEDNRAPIHHNGEYIELYNPSTSDIDISNWIITDSNTKPYIFPTDSKIAARGMVIVAFSFPGTNFKLSDLFPAINSLGDAFLQKNIFYQCNMILCNDGEVLSLYDSQRRLIDKMSYRQKTDGKYSSYWSLYATNGENKNIKQLVSLQRTDIHNTGSAITPTISDYTSTIPTPFDKPANVFFPIVQELNNDPDSNTNGSTPIVGAIPGSAAVSPTGAASYSVPIDVPAGINGMQPSVSVAYNSQGGFGELGIGWGLSGASAISRGNRNLYYDNTNDNIHFDDTSDAIYLDGQRLILLPETGTNLTKGATYATEVENYSRIVYDGSSFKLTTLDGKTMEYGITSDSKLTNANPDLSNDTRVLAWKLNKVTDTHGNSITYTYCEHGQYLAKIEYAGQSVEFGYDNNKNKFKPKNNYINTFLVSQTKILNTITTKSATSALKTYSFVYTDDNRLKTINESAPDGTKLGATTVKWGDESSITEQEVAVMKVPQFPYPNSDIGMLSYMQMGDVNGDGYKDCIEVWSSKSSYQIGYLIIHLYNKELKTFSNKNIDNQLIFPIQANCYIGTSNFADRVIDLKIADINNDGYNEIIFKDIDKVITYKIIDLGDIRSLKEISRISIEGNIGCLTEILDVNHDGYLDLVIVPDHVNDDWFSANNYDRDRDVLLGSKNGLYRSEVKEIDLSNRYFYQYGDFDADGKMDIIELDRYESDKNLYNDEFTVSISKSWGKYIYDCDKYYTADFNGDGLSDMLVQSTKDHQWYLYINTGGYDKEPIMQTTELHNASNIKSGERYELYTLDYNGDGMLDVIIADETFDSNGNFTKTNWYFYRNENGIFILDENKESNYRISSLPFTICDINGDGVDDLVFIKDLSYVAFTKFNANLRNKVNSITNGMEQVESFTYSNFSAYEPYDANNEPTSKIRPLRAPISLVYSYTQPDGNATTYNYEKPKVHTEGKGFLGFTTVTATNTTKNITATSNYGYNSIFYNVFLTSQTVSTVGSTSPDISTTSLENNILNIGNKRFIPIVKKQTVTDLIKGVTKTSIPDYTYYPDKLIQTESIKQKDATANIASTVTTTLNQKRVSTDLIPFLPQKVTIVRTAEGEAVTHTKSYGYTFDITYPFKITKLSETTDPDDPGQVITEYSNYDPYGHPLTTTVKAAKDATGTQQSRGTKVTYLNGRFIDTKTNIQGETTNYSWDESLGTLTSKTDAYKHTTSYRYNAWGQLTETTYPDGTHKTSTLQWATNAAVSGAKYYSYTEASAAAPVTIWYDALGRELQSDSYGLNDKKISVSTEYYNTTDVKNGKVFRVSEPYFDGDTKIWAKTYDYDGYGRPYSVTTPMGTSLSTYDKLSTKVTSPTEGTHTVETDAEGKTTKSTINDKTVSYAYYPSGQTKSSKPDNGIALTMSYDLQGHRLKLIDPDAGVIRNEYNGFGELLTERQKIHSDKDTLLTTHNYDEFGVLQSIDRGVVGRTAEHTSYTYDSHNRVQNVEILNQHSQTFTYDDLDRVTKVQEVIDGRVYNTTKKYEDPYGRLTQEIYPSGYYTVNSYDKYSNLIAVTDGQGHAIWKAGTENARGQTLTETKGNIVSTHTYYDNGLPHQMYTPAGSNQLVNMEYSFYGQEKKYSLSGRADHVNGQTEVFDYDTQNRLTSWTVNGTKNNTISYDDTYGNIQNKSDLGNNTLTYGLKDKDNNPIKPHALNGISGTPADFPTADLQVTYTDFKKIKMLCEGNKYYEITYGVDDQRRKSTYEIIKKAGNETGAILTKYYLENYEEEINSLGNVRKIHYLGGAILIQETNQPDKLYYSYSDYQGSLLALADASGNIERYAYDPWGKRRNPSNWNENDGRTSWIINRGYTGHEHLDAFGIINMNGRVYDPLTAMFFSPDPFVQAPGNWLNYNRYGYCYGNPLIYSDPTGQITLADIASGISIIAGFALEFTPATQKLGSYLIAAGFKHFGLTIDNLQASSHYNQPMSWDQASNIAGFEFCYSFDVNWFEPKNTPKNIGSGYNGSSIGSTNEETNDNKDVHDKYEPFESNLLKDKLKTYNNYMGFKGLNIVYGPFKDSDGWTGVEIFIDYSNGKDLSNSDWEQYLISNYPAARISDRAYPGHNVEYWDDDGRGDHKYYTDVQMKSHIINNGKNVTFGDAPSRPKADGTTYFKANLYLIEDHQPILKIYYGYTSANGIITVLPIQVIK